MIAIIGSLYYISGVFAIIKLLHSLKDFQKVSNIKEWCFRFRLVIGRSPKSEEYPDKKDVETDAAHKALDAFDFLWMAAGLLSGNHSIFAILMAAWIANAILAKYLSFGTLWKFFSFMIILAKISLYSWMICNHFFIHGDISAILKTWL